MRLPHSTNNFSQIINNSKYLSNILIKKPYFFARLAKNYMKLPFTKDNLLPLRFVDIAVTYNCNMRCTHCSSTLLKKSKNELNKTDYEKIANMLAKAGALVINFTGGDPFIRPDFEEIIKAFDPKRFLIAVQTNGFAASEEKLLLLKNLGVDSIGISIDSADATKHDTFRNTPGAFLRALECLKTARRLGFNVGISYCLTHSNLHSKDREQIVKIAREHGAILNYNLAVPIGFWRGQSECMLTKDDRYFLEQLLKKQPYTKTDFQTNYFRQGCGAIKEKVYVSAYGDVMPCPFIQVSFGNLLEDDIDTIRNRAMEYYIFRNYIPYCPAAEDKNFIANTLCYDKDYSGELPVSYKKAFKSQG